MQRQSREENVKGWIRVHACTCALNLEVYPFIYLMMVGENDLGPHMMEEPMASEITSIIDRPVKLIERRVLL